MGIVTDYYLEAGLEKAEYLGNQISSTWKGSSVKETVEALQHFQFQKGEIVDIEDDTYEITDRDVFRTFLTGKETYEADRLLENPDGELRKSYHTETIRGDQIQ